MGGVFDPRLKAHELPRATLVELWRRTVDAHERLSTTWHSAISDKYGAAVADEAALSGWPRKAIGASPKELFYDDLRFIVAATELQPDMLTVARRDQAETPSELTVGRSWFRLVTSLSPSPKRGPSKSTTPTWIGSPGLVAGPLRGRGIQLGFTVLLKAWRSSQGTKPLPFDVDAFERKVADTFDEKTLALLWNYAAIAYMLGTDRWYTQMKKRYGDESAQLLEKEVWLDRGAAEHDLQIGFDAVRADGSNVETLFRGFQFAPGEVGILSVEFDLKDENHGVMTHHKCPALDRFEHFDDARLKHCCDICIAGMPLSGEMLNKKISCKPLKLPPRVDSNDIACKWEYTLSDAD